MTREEWKVTFMCYLLGILIMGSYIWFVTHYNEKTNTIEFRQSIKT